MKSLVRCDRGPITLLAFGAVLGVCSGIVINSKSNANVPKDIPDHRVRLDIRAWLKDYRKADKRGQEALLRRLLVQDGSCMDTLSQSLREDKAATAEVLAALWRWKRLPSAARLEIIRSFLSISLVEQDAWDARNGHRELVIQAERHFPFPQGTWLKWSYSIAIDGGPLRLDTKSWNTRDWEGAGTLRLGSLGSWRHFGAPSANAVIEVWEEDQGKVVWRHRWRLGPTRLRFIAPPRPSQ